MAVELVDYLKQHGFWIRITCPRCNAEGTLTTLNQFGYLYLVVRHIDKRTHTVPKRRVDEVLCRVEQNLAQTLKQILEVYKKYENVSGNKHCTDAAEAEK
jgi:hypothetical protein